MQAGAAMDRDRWFALDGSFYGRGVNFSLFTLLLHLIPDLDTF